jgi:hypothetical protein
VKKSKKGEAVARTVGSKTVEVLVLLHCVDQVI